MKKNYCIAVIMAMVLLSGCRKMSDRPNILQENKEAKILLQGIWLDDITDDVVFKVKGDTVFYQDSTSAPAYFRINADTLIIGKSHDKYSIVKQTELSFCFQNANGDIIRLRKSDNPNDSLFFVNKKTEPLIVTDDLKKDTVVIFQGERYHCYVAINPTSYKVIKTSISDDGVKVDNVYFDNIIHLSIYQGRNQLFSKDFHKSMFDNFVPGQFLKQAILKNMDFCRVDSEGFHFNTIVCIPDGDSCYMLDTKITTDGRMALELIEY
ncbi:MAG: DUF4738 domain-containing protein [Prevotella sp.]